MKVLAFDAATTCCSVACWFEGNILASSELLEERKQSEKLISMIVDTMVRADFTFASLSVIAVTYGPGSFTGVRIGLAAARGLAMASNLPLEGVTTLEALAAAPSLRESENRIICASIDARRNQIYGQLFDENHIPLSTPFIDTVVNVPRRIAEVSDKHVTVLLVGSGSTLVAPILRETTWKHHISACKPHPEATVIAKLVGNRGYKAVAGESLAPFYLRQAIV